MKVLSRKNVPVGLTRYELYRAIWSEPVSRVARRIGVSDVALANICRRSLIPLPGRGYWQKKAAGTAHPRPPLPPCEELPERIIVRMRHRDVEMPEAPRRWKVRVIGDLENLHAVAAEVRCQLGKRRRRHPYVVQHVRTAHADRAVLILDALARTADEHGHRIWVGEDGLGWFGNQEGDAVPFTLSGERCSSVLHLQWQADVQGNKTFSDCRSRSLEARLGQFLASMEDVLAVVRKRRLHREAWERRQERAMRRKAEAEKQAEIISPVIAAMRRWEEAEGLRRFAEAVERSSSVSDQLVALAAAARDHADRIDPMVADKPAEFRTCDYMGFEAWWSQLQGIPGSKQLRQIDIKDAFSWRMSPEEAVEELAVP